MSLKAIILLSFINKEIQTNKFHSGNFFITVVKFCALIVSCIILLNKNNYVSEKLSLDTLIIYYKTNVKCHLLKYST